MKVIRPIHPGDLDRFEEIVFQSSIGITSLPKDRHQLALNIKESEQAFAASKTDPHHLLYLFVMEDLKTERLVGTCGIRGKTGVKHPIHSYRIETVEASSHIPHASKKHRILRAIKHQNGPSEVCALFLDPECRKSSLGYLLSYSRFLFMANHPERFTDTVIAEMRGVFDENNENAFWNFVGRAFYDVSYNEAVNTRLETPDIIPELIAQFPLYIDLLPKEVQEVIGKTHPNTGAALNLLLKIGFSITDEVDIFDAGPKLTAPLKNVIPFKESHMHPVLSISDDLSEDPWIIANTKLDYRACVGHLQIKTDGVILEKKTLDALKIERGDHVRLYQI